MRNITTLLPKTFFFLFLSDLRIKLNITTIIDYNFFEGMTYRLYISLLFDFQNKQKNDVNLND